MHLNHDLRFSLVSAVRRHAHSIWRAPVPRILGVGALLVVVGATGCKDLTGSQALPSGTPDPSLFNTTAGALGMRNSALFDVGSTIPFVVLDMGLFTDEVESPLVGVPAGTVTSKTFPLDERILPEQTSGTSTRADNDYAGLQGIRGDVSLALPALAAYDTASNVSLLRGELYALDGYAEILLADFFCSGVPLSTLDFQKDYTYHASSNTLQVYQDAITQEDSALALLAGASASDTVLNLARVLKGRALLGQGKYAAAAQAVALVPDGFQYRMTVPWTPPTTDLAIAFISTLNAVPLSNNEGGNGLPYLSSGDPRTAETVLDNTTFGVEFGLPTRYNATISNTNYVVFPVANWIEARLIQAEAALQAAPNDPAWLTLLNHLRLTATVPGMAQPFPATDTLTDPGSGAGLDTARIALLFRERAYWLYLSAHRQGDARRLIRQYGQYGFTQDHVYPTGRYLAPGVGTYGTDVTAPIPSGEYANPLFHGCLDRHA